MFENFSVNLDSVGFTFSGICNADSKKPHIICLHGWLDNAMSFAPLLNNLPQYNFLALDLPGHGKSSWLPAIVPAYSMQHTAFCLYHYLKTLPFPVILVGHSLGAGLATLLAALFPKQIQALVLLDNVTPLPNETGSFSILKQLADTPSPANKLFETFDAAVKARTKHGLDQTSAKLLAQRSVEKNVHGQFFWNHDPRLKTVSFNYFSNPDILDMLSAIACKTLYIYGDWSYKYSERLLAAQQIKHVEIYNVTGDHYFHMNDPASCLPQLKRFFKAI